MIPSALPPRQLVGNTAMLKSACCSPLGAGKGAGAVAPVAGRRRSGSSSSSSSILRAGAGKEPEVTVFDAEGGVSWEEYKKQKPDEYQVRQFLLPMKSCASCHVLAAPNLIPRPTTSRSYEYCLLYTSPSPRD